MCKYTIIQGMPEKVTAQHVDTTRVPPLPMPGNHICRLKNCRYACSAITLATY